MVEVEPRSLRVVRRISHRRPGRRDYSPRAVRLWVGFGRSATAIARLDPTQRRGQARCRSACAPRPGSTAGTRDLWIQAADNVLVRVDAAKAPCRPAGSRSGSTLGQGALAADGTLWVPDKEQGFVYRVDPAAGRVLDSFPAGPGAFLALRAHGSMWVPSYAGDDVWRFSP